MEEQEKCVCPAGIPAWVMTFADLMSLLMCFFVLLLAFSEMDVEKFKQLAGSMKNAFGVQREIELRTIPKGTSVIAKEFSPGKPEPTIVNDIRQKTMMDFMKNLEAKETEKSQGVELLEDEAGGEASNVGDGAKKGDGHATGALGGATDKQAEAQSAAEKIADDTSDLFKKNAKDIEDALRLEIELGLIEVDLQNKMLVIRILEEGAFPSGTAVLQPKFIKIISKVRDKLADIYGDILVIGNTDNVPIRNGRFISNWDLSAARALAVGHELMRSPKLDESRLRVIGNGSGHPRFPNTSEENRAKNRRVEIKVIDGKLFREADTVPEHMKKPPEVKSAAKPKSVAKPAAQVPNLDGRMQESDEGKVLKLPGSLWPTSGNSKVINKATPADAGANHDAVFAMDKDEKANVVEPHDAASVKMWENPGFKKQLEKTKEKFSWINKLFEKKGQ